MFHEGMNNFWLILLLAVMPCVKGLNCPVDYCTCTNAVTNCSNRNLTTIPVGISVTVHRLYLNNNSIILIEFPEEWGQLSLLDLRWNKITSLVDGPFKRFKRLTELYLDHNEINELKFPFDHLETTLRRLSLSYNKISGNVSEHVFTYLEVLEYLNVSHNQISFFEARSFYSTLLELDISYNNISSLDPEKFYDLTNLQYLDMRGLQIENYQVNIFGHMDSLKRLRLGGSRIMNISESVFFGLNNSLETLEIVDSPLISLPTKLLVYCSNIKTLDISNNKITFLEKAFFDNAPSLIHLNLENNRLSDGILLARSLKPLSRLSILDLTSNLLTESYAVIINTLLNLNDVSFAKNHLQIVNESLVSSTLQKLDLSHNAIRAVDVTSLENCSSLVHLDLSGNKLISLPKIQSSSNLDKAVTASPPSKTLEITVDDNPWNCSCEFYKNIEEAKALTFETKLVCAEKNDLSCITCAYPVNLRNVSAADLFVHFPGCVTEIKSIDLTALYIVLVLLFLIIIVLVVYFCLKRGCLKTEATAKQDSTLCTPLGNKKNRITLYCCCMGSNEEQKRGNLQNKRQVNPKPLPQNNNTGEITETTETSLSVTAEQAAKSCDNCSCQSQVGAKAVSILNENTNSCKPMCSCKVNLSNNGSTSNRHAAFASDDPLLSANFEDLKRTSKGYQNEDLALYHTISIENQKSNFNRSNQNNQNCLNDDVKSAKNHNAVSDDTTWL